MGKTRLEAFSDGVIAILITIMMLELKVARGAELAVLFPLWPVFIYLLGFLYIGIYWNNLHYRYHHCLRLTDAGAETRDYLSRLLN
jgi:uncharacterized membrane protein